MIHIQNSPTHKIGFAVKLKLQVTQHARDIDLMKKLVEYLGCGLYKLRPGELAGDFLVLRFSDIRDKVIPFFNLYPIQGVKGGDFENFCKVADIIEAGGHLTPDGLEQIRLLKSNKHRRNI